MAELEGELMTAPIETARAEVWNPLADIRPMDPTGGAVWILLGAFVLAFVLVWLVVTGLADGAWTGGYLIGAVLCVLGIVALWPLGALVDTEAAPLGELALRLRPLALILGAGYPLYLLLTTLGRR